MKAKAWLIYGNYPSDLPYYWVIYLGTVQISSLKYYTTPESAKESCLKWAKKLNLEIKWLRGKKK